MVGEITVRYCPICKEDTENQEGNYRVRVIDGRYFHLESSFEDARKKLSAGFNYFVLEEKSGVVAHGAAAEYINTEEAEPIFEQLFAKRVRSQRCSQCGHLIKLPRFP